MTAVAAFLDEGASDPETPRVRAQDVYSHTHPMTTRSLNGMGDKLKELKDRQEEVKSMSEQITDANREAAKERSRGAALQRIMAGAKADAHAQERVLSKLEDEDSHLEHEHDSVALKLQAIIKPRIGAVEHKLERRREAVTKTQMDMKQWDHLRSKYKASALQTLSDRDEKLKAVQTAEEEIKKAEQQEDDAKLRYEEARKKLSHDIEAYKFSQTRFAAIQSKVADQKDKEAQAETSLTRTRTIFKVEGQRIDSALKFSEEKLKKRITTAKAQHEKARRRFILAKERLQAWKTKQQKLERKVEDLKDEYDGRQQDVNENRNRVLTSASSSAGERATSQSGWTGRDWAYADLGSDMGDIAEIDL